jgi:DNA mismatch repair protein MutH
MQMELKQLEEELKSKFLNYYGLSFKRLAQEVGLNAQLIKGKLSTVTVINKMLIDAGIVKSKFILNGLNVSVKTVKLKENGVPKESMSFEQIDFLKVSQERWEDSFIRKKFLNTIFCFFVFQEFEGIAFFRGVKVWKMPQNQVESKVYYFWRHLKSVLIDGVEITKQKKGSKFILVNNLPSSSDNYIMHVRPKAKDSNDTVELPCGNLITKQAYWINAAFISQILKDMPAVEKKVGFGKVSNEIDINWNQILQEDIYTFEEVINKGKSIHPHFTELNIDEESLVKSGYHIESSYVIREGLGKLDQYLSKKILTNNYFDSKSESIFETPYIKRKIENYENAYKLLKVESSLYLTEAGVKSAQVDIEEIKSFKEEVEEYVEGDTFFTLESIKSDGFNHPVDEYGFDNIFYEHLLKRPGRLKNLTLDSKTFYNKTIKKVTISDLFEIILGDLSVLTVSQLLDEIEDIYKVRLSFEGLENALNNLDKLYYNPEMKRLFSSKQAYLDFLY